MGALFVGFSIYRLVLVDESRDWPGVDGVIVSSGVRIGGKNNGLVNVDVQYRYTVDGLEYRGATAGYGFDEAPFGSDAAAAREKAERFRTGTTQTVYYRPESPSVSCLIRGGARAGFAIPIGAGLLFALFGGWGFYRLIRPKKV